MVIRRKTMFFSVKQPLKIAGKVYIPCVCYALPETLKETIEHLKKENKAEIYGERVYFCNGKIVDKAVTETVAKTKKVKKNKDSETEAQAPVEDTLPEDEGF